MNTDQVALLIDLAQTHSFNQTAERLYTTQQNVSYKVKQLERELDVAIFLRSNSGVTFTAEGEYVLQCAYEMEKAYQSMKRKIRARGDSNEQRINLIKIYISSVLLSSKMTEVIKAFNAEFPHIKLVIKEAVPDEVFDSFFANQCDLAFLSIYQGYIESFYADCRYKGIETELICEDYAIAVVSKKSQLAEKDRLSLYDISHHPKSVFGVLPKDYFGRNAESYILYENTNLDIHKQLILEENAICFTSHKTYDQLFTKELFVEKSFDYPTLPIEHILLKKNGSDDFIVRLENIIYDKI